MFVPYSGTHIELKWSLSSAFPEIWSVGTKNQITQVIINVFNCNVTAKYKVTHELKAHQYL